MPHNIVCSVAAASSIRKLEWLIIIIVCDVCSNTGERAAHNTKCWINPTVAHKHTHTFQFESFNWDYSTAKSVRSFMISATILLNGSLYTHAHTHKRLWLFHAAFIFIYTHGHKFLSNDFTIGLHAFSALLAAIEWISVWQATIQSFLFRFFFCYIRLIILKRIHMTAVCSVHTNGHSLLMKTLWTAALYGN